MIQADLARMYGARVYCVGVKDFDEEQVTAYCFQDALAYLYVTLHTHNMHSYKRCLFTQYVRICVYERTYYALEHSSEISIKLLKLQGCCSNYRPAAFFLSL